MESCLHLAPLTFSGGIPGNTPEQVCCCVCTWHTLCSVVCKHVVSLFKECQVCSRTPFG